ncbi:class I SAM-dependent methyltransferase [Roseivivax sediminis]|uniref:Methyltransferase domain-containing protein n=1 Tax=Roseivivax sediminis TaxID=936889 RepID=A0A1I1ZNG2_9RHOB|nr:class I SAM-dependent methyltransferase [Roseivivax sediminis]SFE33162.1 Methyltransferase domain-containing protein [Roseivivax sediminis]
MENRDELAEMLAVNAEQAKYYDSTDGGSTSEVNSFATNLWRKIRWRAISAVPDHKREVIYRIQQDWLGDLAGKKVLEVGAGTGSYLTSHLVANCAQYDAIELSGVQIRALRDKIGDAPHVRCIEGDFLDCDRLDDDYDVIYAQSFLHHFRHVDVLFDRIEAVTKPGAQIVTLDPLQTWLPARLFRAAFRPFQTDAAWEFPFGHGTLDRLQDRFVVEDRFGLYGRSKWAIALSMLSPKTGHRLGQRWFDWDFETDYVRHRARSCLILSCNLRTAGGPVPAQPRRI